MFYQQDEDDHGLLYNPFKSIIVPRPIGWITTLDLRGRVNLAPYSQFQNIGYDPPYILFSSYSDRHKHTAANCLDTGEFVTNMATYDLREAINITAQPVQAGVDEAQLAGLEIVPSKIVKPPWVAAPRASRVQILLFDDSTRPTSRDSRHSGGRPRRRAYISRTNTSRLKVGSTSSEYVRSPAWGTWTTRP